MTELTELNWKSRTLKGWIGPNSGKLKDSGFVFLGRFIKSTVKNFVSYLLKNLSIINKRNLLIIVFLFYMNCTKNLKMQLI